MKRRATLGKLAGGTLACTLPFSFYINSTKKGIDLETVRTEIKKIKKT